MEFLDALPLNHQQCEENKTMEEFTGAITSITHEIQTIFYFNKFVIELEDLIGLPISSCTISNFEIYVWIIFGFVSII